MSDIIKYSENTVEYHFANVSKTIKAGVVKSFDYAILKNYGYKGI